MFQHFLQKILIPLEACPGDARSLTAWAVQALLWLAPGFAEHQSRLGDQSNLVIYQSANCLWKASVSMHSFLLPTAESSTEVREARKLQEHQRQQYQDRSLYWGLRFSSTHDASVLTIIIDGMGKWGTAWPHLGHDRPSKDMDGVVRPQLVLTAALAHGWGTFLFGTSELENHGADAWLSWVELACLGQWWQCVTTVANSQFLFLGKLRISFAKSCPESWTLFGS